MAVLWTPAVDFVMPWKASLKATDPLFWQLKVAAFLAAAVSPGDRQWSKLRDCIGDLVGLPHRMELVHKDAQQTSWINDSKATNVASVQVCQAGSHPLDMSRI